MLPSLEEDMDEHKVTLRRLAALSFFVCLAITGCKTATLDRDRQVDEALTRRRPSKTPAQPSPEPRPEFKQEPPRSQ